MFLPSGIFDDLNSPLRFAGASQHELTSLITITFPFLFTINSIYGLSALLHFEPPHMHLIIYFQTMQLYQL